MPFPRLSLPHLLFRIGCAILSSIIKRTVLSEEGLLVLRGTALYEKPFFFLYLRRLTVFVPWEGAALVLRRDEAWLEASV
jgi:hypothetical protein